MFETAASWLGYFPHHYWHRGEEPVRLGMRHQYITPYGPYLAGDGKYVGVACASQADWEIFCRDVIRRPELLEDARFKTTEARRKNRDALEEIIVACFREHPSEVWLKRLEAARLPYGSVNGVAEVLSHPQMIARHMIQEIDSPVGRVPVMATPLHLSDSPQRLDPVPELGGDNEVDPARARLHRVRDRRLPPRRLLSRFHDRKRPSELLTLRNPGRSLRQESRELVGTPSNFRGMQEGIRRRRNESHITRFLVLARYCIQEVCDARGVQVGEQPVVIAPRIRKDRLALVREHLCRRQKLRGEGLRALAICQPPTKVVALVDNRP